MDSKVVPITHEHSWAGLEIGRDGRVFLERGTDEEGYPRESRCSVFRERQGIIMGKEGRADAKPQRFLITKVIYMVIFCK